MYKSSHPALHVLMGVSQILVVIHDPHIRFNFISPQICSVFGINGEELSTLQDQGLETKPKRYEASVDRYQVIMIFRLVGKRPLLHC